MKKALAYYLELKYDLRMTYDEDDKAWFVSFPDLPGCLADGDTPPEALKNAARVKKEWIRSALEEGWEVPEPAPPIEVSGRLTFRPPKTIHKRLIERAGEEGVSLNQLLTTYAVQGLDCTDAKAAIKEAAVEQMGKYTAVSYPYVLQRGPSVDLMPGRRALGQEVEGGQAQEGSGHPKRVSTVGGVSEAHVWQAGSGAENKYRGRC